MEKVEPPSHKFRFETTCKAATLRREKKLELKIFFVDHDGKIWTLIILKSGHLSLFLFIIQQNMRMNRRPFTNFQSIKQHRGIKFSIRRNSGFIRDSTSMSKFINIPISEFKIKMIANNTQRLTNHL